MRKRLVLTLMLAALATGLSFGQPPFERSREHERLEFLLGSWDVKGTTLAPGAGTPGKVPMTGTMTCEWVLEGTWLMIRNDDMFGERPVHHLALATWDPSVKKYIRRVFTDSSAIHPLEEGRWIDDKTFEFAGEFGWDDGNTYGFRNVYTLVSDSELRFEMHQNVNKGEYFLRAEAVLRKQGQPRDGS